MSTPVYQGPTKSAAPGLAPRNAPRSYIMKARLFLLAVSVAPLAVMLGAVRARI